MLATVKIKEEPLDEIKDSEEIFKKGEYLMKQEINGVEDQSASCNNFHIVEEQESVITVNAVDMLSEDEMRFIDSLNKSDTTNFNGVCSKCLKSFTNRVQFLKHTKRNHCLTKHKCSVCPVTFTGVASMVNHLNLHRENFFFCSLHCGANYATLPLCEEHELKEHKIQAIPKIRYKHFCSFCREGFKMELQLHVHWLQQTQGCGKLMQDVVLHSANIANLCDNMSNSKIIIDNQLKSSTTNIVSTIPITKLRLKYATTSNTQSKTKRQNYQNEEETARKRIKMFEKTKSETKSSQAALNFETDIQIKEEPTDDFEGTITSQLIPEVIIKTEEENKSEQPRKHPMMNLVINNMIGPESNGKFIPIEEFVTSENSKIESRSEMKMFSINSVNSNDQAKTNNMNNQKLPVLKLINNNVSNININNQVNNTAKKNGSDLRLAKIAPAPSSMPNKSFGSGNFENIQKCNNDINGDIKPLPKSGLQIIKLLPNSKVMTTNAGSNNNMLLNGKNPLIFKFQATKEASKNTKSLLCNNKQLMPKMKKSHTAVLETPIVKSTSAPAVTVNSTRATVACHTPNSNITTSNTVSIPLNCLQQNTTIDAEDFKKLQAEALIKAEEHKKNFYVPKNRLMIIENMPEKKEIIDNMKQQIAEAETKKTEQIQRKPAANFALFKTKNIDEPPSMHLPILTAMDIPLVQARYKNPHYNYKWICPYCLKDYDLKTALKMHLFKAHNLNTRDMEKINVQARPYKKEVLPVEDVKPQIKEEPFAQDADSQSFEIFETESLNADSMASSSPKHVNLISHKQQRARYVCDKCGRTCSSKTMLKDHVLANCSREPQYACTNCPKKFFSHGTLQCHMTIHTGEMPHKCNYCDKRFRTRGQVRVHHRTHTGERPFFCQVCSQRFTHRETLIAHLSRHIGMKRYKCYSCNKHFSCISALKTHREIRADTCGKVKFNPRAIGPRVRVIRGNVVFEPQPEINPYLKSEDPKSVLFDLEN